MGQYTDFTGGRRGPSPGAVRHMQTILVPQSIPVNAGDYLRGKRVPSVPSIFKAEEENYPFINVLLLIYRKGLC